MKLRERGAVEVAPCVFDLLGNVANGMEITLFRGICGGQTRNINICTMLLHAVRTLSVPTVNPCFFFNPGHSQMEVESAHAKTEG